MGLSQLNPSSPPAKKLRQPPEAREEALPITVAAPSPRSSMLSSMATDVETARRARRELFQKIEEERRAQRALLERQQAEMERTLFTAAHTTSLHTNTVLRLGPA